MAAVTALTAVRNINILQPQLFSATERVTTATVTRTTPFQEEKAVLSDRGSAQLCIYYPGTPDTTGINHIQFVPSVFCCCQPRSRSLVLCQQCIQFLLQRNEKTAKSQSKALWDTFQLHIIWLFWATSLEPSSTKVDYVGVYLTTKTLHFQKAAIPQS